MSIVAHPQTLRVKDAVFGCVRERERGRVCVGEPLRRQAEGRIVVENFDAMCVSRLVDALPRGCRVFCRAPTNGEGRVTLSKLEIYYPLETAIWRRRAHIMFFVWIVLPVVSSFIYLFAYDLVGSNAANAANAATTLEDGGSPRW